ncbi:hypothetical protein AQUCO_00200547v1 [Aquilegia coerulea]|uniref:Glutaredoxin domain-containing protein n=1 Tax=Aquilegia coerulea TaxID=218851 RepID=A0A2G5F3Q9_AQUCA|nr:hypothetical protein AQUCO_00200547v1 [Aquilegia coerulea]
MGCASSKQTRCENCQKPYSSLPRSYSVPVHHPASRKGDSYHVVALTSSTLGSLPVDSIDGIHFHAEKKTPINNRHINDSSGKEFLTEVLQAKNWSNMIEEKIPKVIPRTPIMTPPGEPETINTWELMEGLDDCSPLRLCNNLDRSFSFHAVSNTSPLDECKLGDDDIDSPTIGHSKPKLQENGMESLKPQWMNTAEDDSMSNVNAIVSEFDPEIVSQFRKALEELSPVATANLKSPEREKTPFSRDNHFLLKDFMETTKGNDSIVSTKCPPGGEDKVVIYFTSLRGVRKTYEDCCHVRVIFKGLSVRIDERDVSMHYLFREELRELLGDGGYSGGLPRVFVKGRYIGGAEEIKQLNEDGKLEKLVEGCTAVEEGNILKVCELCGDVRFVPCESCSGSCKIFCEDGDEWGEGEDGVGEFQRCPDCNENGLVRCPVCCY